jgi:hypothetical protein
LAIPIDLRAAKALPRNGGRRPLVDRKAPREGGGARRRVGSFLFIYPSFTYFYIELEFI